MDSLIECQNCKVKIGLFDVTCWHCRALNERGSAAIQHVQGYLLQGLDIDDPYIWMWQEALLKVSVLGVHHGVSKWLVIDFSSAIPAWITNDTWYFKNVLRDFFK